MAEGYRPRAQLLIRDVKIDISLEAASCLVVTVLNLPFRLVCFTTAKL